MERIKEFFSNLTELIGRMTPSQVMMLLGVIAGTIVGIVFVFGWVSSVQYSRLYSDLDESQAGEIIAYLNEEQVPFELHDGGRSIEVPTDKVYQTRISLASRGLPQSGSVGYSIFDETNFGMTDFVQNLNFRRALEGELTRTIMELNEVQAARVHIVMPKDKLFRQDQKDATASVVLKLRGSAGLDRRQVSGITHLVASSVEGLEPKNITIVDYDGNLLSSPQQNDELAGLSASQLDVRQRVESYLQQKAQSMMDDVLGPGKSVIRVTAELNFAQIERTSETFDPNSPAIRSEQREQSTGSASDKSNEEGAENQEQQSTESVTTNYELNKTVEHIVNAVGTVQRLAVAVMVDGTYRDVENAEGIVESVYEPRPQDELDRLGAIVRNAVGFNPQRNDQIEMVNIAFDRDNLQDDREALDKMYQREFFMDVAQKVLIILVVVVALLWFRKRIRAFFRSMATLMPPTPQPVAAVPEPVQTEEEDEEEEIKPIEAKKRRPRLLDQMQKTANDKPEEIARVIKTLMVE